MATVGAEDAANHVAEVTADRVNISGFTASDANIIGNVFIAGAFIIFTIFFVQRYISSDGM